jgi:hypothetical protein
MPTGSSKIHGCMLRLLGKNDTGARTMIKSNCKNEFSKFIDIVESLLEEIYCLVSYDEKKGKMGFRAHDDEDITLEIKKKYDGCFDVIWMRWCYIKRSRWSSKKSLQYYSKDYGNKTVLVQNLLDEDEKVKTFFKETEK